MEDNKITLLELEKFIKENCIIKGHFLLGDGYHSEYYINLDPVLKNPEKARMIYEMMASKFYNYEIDVVIGPETGGVSLANGIAEFLNKHTSKSIRRIFAGPAGHKILYLPKEFYITRNEKVLIVDDIVDTGNTLRALINIVKASEGNISGMSFIVKRNELIEKEVFKNIKNEYLFNMPFDRFSPFECKLCQHKIPIGLKWYQKEL